MDGQDPAARNAAIATAVQDAMAQANAAADAAGIQLGAIVDMQVSAMPYYYPMVGSTAGSGSSPYRPAVPEAWSPLRLPTCTSAP